MPGRKERTGGFLSGYVASFFFLIVLIFTIATVKVHGYVLISLWQSAIPAFSSSPSPALTLPSVGAAYHSGVKEFQQRAKLTLYKAP